MSALLSYRMRRITRKAAARLTRSRIILIGGAPTAGKSAIAEQVAAYLGLPWLSTDQIRKIMRAIANRADHPSLFKPDGYDAKRFFDEFSADQIVRMQFEEGEAVWKSARPFIRENWVWTRGFVLEGVHVLPHLVARDLKDDARVRAVFLIDEDIGRVRRVIATRGLWGDARAYPDEIKEKEVEWVIRFGQRLKSEAGKFGYPFVEIRKDRNDLKAMLAAIGSLAARGGPF